MNIITSAKSFKNHAKFMPDILNIFNLAKMSCHVLLKSFKIMQDIFAREQGLCDRACPFKCIYIICDPPINLNGTLEVDSPLQTLAIN